MRLKRVLLMGVVLVAMLIPACGKSEPAPTTAPVAIPDLQKPASSNTPSSGGQADTPVPPASKAETAYPVPGEQPEPEAYPVPLEGSALLELRCTVCHPLDRVRAAKKDAAGWQSTVNRMIGHGAQVTPDELNVLVDYLAATYK